MTEQEIIKVVQGFLDGKQIQSKLKIHYSWNDNPNPRWNFATNDYRIKPEPREWWVNINDKGMPYTWAKAEYGKPHDMHIKVREVLDD